MFLKYDFIYFFISAVLAFAVLQYKFVYFTDTKKEFCIKAAKRKDLTTEQNIKNLSSVLSLWFHELIKHLFI